MKDFQSLVEETKVLVQKEIENKDNRPDYILRNRGYLGLFKSISDSITGIIRVISELIMASRQLLFRTVKMVLTLDILRENENVNTDV